MKAKGLAAALAMLMLVGCTLTRTDLRKGADALLPQLGAGGKLIVPRQCALKMVIVTRPATDTALGEALWRVADTQAIDGAARRALETNGLRVGLVTGDLPDEVRAVLDAPPPQQVHPAVVILPDGDSTEIDLGAEDAELDLLLARSGSVNGKRYKDAKGYFRLSASRAGESGVALRIVPELHHGPVRPNWGPAPGGMALAPQQLVMRNGQQEETFRDLAATVELHAGQVAVIAALPGTRGTLGGFLMTAPEPNSDRLLSKVLFVWASRSEDGESADPVLPPGLQPVDPSELDMTPVADAPPPLDPAPARARPRG